MRSYESLDTDDKSNPRMARIAQVLVATLGVLASIWLFWNVRSRERELARTDFEVEAVARFSTVQRELSSYLEQVHSLRALWASSHDVENQEFKTFTSHSLGRYRAIRALLYVEKTPGPDAYSVTFREGDEAFAVPARLGSLPIIASTLVRCDDIGSLVVSAPTSAVVPANEVGIGKRVVAALSVQSDEQTGYAVALIDVQRLVYQAQEQHPGEYRLFVEDELPTGRVLLSGDGELGELDSPRSIEVGERTWRITCTTGPDFVAGYITLKPWFALFLGLAGTALLLTTVASAAGRSQVARLAERRTQEVQQAYGTLAQEAQERMWAVAMTRQLEKQLREIIDLVPNMIYVKDWYGRFLLVNEATAKAYGSTVDELCSARDVDLKADQEADAALKEERALMESGLSSVVQAMPFVDSKGRRRILRTVKIPCVFGNEERAMLCVSTDITQQQHAENILQSQNRILSELARGANTPRVLNELVNAAEEIVPGLRCSVLLLEHDGRHLRHGSAPSLPGFYNEAVDGIEIGPTVGSCGASAHCGQRVVVEDVMSHPNWESYRDLAKRANIRASWSEPIRARDGEILGTFAMYYSEPRKPEAFEEKLIESLAQLAGLAIERSQVSTKS